MTTELEKQFYQCFGIEPTKGCTAYDELGEEIADEICEDYCPECFYFKEVYPQIADRHYLELICALNIADKDVSIFNSRKLDRLKDEILFDCIEFFEEIGTEEACQRLKHQVQAIFEGER